MNMIYPESKIRANLKECVLMRFYRFEQVDFKIATFAVDVKKRRQV